MNNPTKKSKSLFITLKIIIIKQIKLKYTWKLYISNPKYLNKSTINDITKGPKRKNLSTITLDNYYKILMTTLT